MTGFDHKIIFDKISLGIIGTTNPVFCFLPRLLPYCTFGISVDEMEMGRASCLKNKNNRYY